MKKIFNFLFVLFILIGCKSIDNNYINNDLEFHLDHISIYMTSPPKDPIIDDKLIELINSAKELDICFYGLNRENVINAIENTISNGVHARFVGNYDLNDDYYKGYKRIALALDNNFGSNRADNLEGEYNDFKLTNKKAIMHNKFVIIKTTDDKEYLYFGTTNCTDTGFKKNNNNSLIIQDSNIVKTYRRQFEYLLGLRDTPISKITTHIIDGIKFEILFSPIINEEKTTIDYLMDIANKADDTFHFMIFSFPYMPLNMLMLEKHNNGIDIKGVIDKSQKENCAEEYLAQHGLPIKIDGNNHNIGIHGGKLHHKTMIIDSNRDDAVVITGSFNWSKNANENNDENIIFIYSKEIAQFYEKEFNRRWQKGKKVKIVTNTGDQANYQDIIINEVMWMGARKDNGKSEHEQEFIELKNLTDKKINLSGWSIVGAAKSQKPIVLKSNTFILPNSFLVIMNKFPCLSKYAYNPPKYIRHKQTSVTNSDILLILEDIDRKPIDYASDGSDGKNFAGLNDSYTKKKNSMSRKSIIGDGRDINNWFTTPDTKQENIDPNFDKYTFATPGAEND